MPDDHPDAARRYHALAELLDTELGYLVDLRTLVSIYLRLLPVLKVRSPLPLPTPPAVTPAAAAASNPSITHLARHAPSVRTHSHPHLATHPVPPDTRHLFSASDLDTITRNAEVLLALHETLVHQLRLVVSPLGIPMRPLLENPPASVHRAIDAVATVFLDHASSFDQYQSFCSGHSEAFDIVRKVQHKYPAEWDAFELRCAALAADTHLLIPLSESAGRLVDLYKRRHSFSTLDEPSSHYLAVHPLSASECGHADSSQRSRLTFMDYMIKPVQRVCRYPLLFDQLQDRAAPQRFSHSTFHTLDPAQTALRTMRAVASRVDDARRQQDLCTKSLHIVSRITQGLLTLAASHNRPLQSAALPAFLSSLAPCHLAGSLDVIHYRGTNMARLGTVRAKYLGAFLFPGGFLVLVKVAKSKAYEPKHWFNLRSFEVVDSNLDDVLLPSWFRLSSKAHMFEFAASCRREKDIWVDAIRRAIAEEAPWSDDPPSSLQADLAASLLESIHFDTISPLPTIQSIPELDDVDATAPNPGETPSVHLHIENPARQDTAEPQGRRSSIAPQPTPMPESTTLHLVRSTASAREHVDRGLLDVFSEKCLTARCHAHTHEEDLFEAQRVTRSFSRSTSALTMASAMGVAAKNRLTKRESVLVPRKRSFLEGGASLTDTENGTTSAHAVVPNPLTKRQENSKLKVIATTTSQEGDGGGNELCLEPPSPVSHCSSVSFATPATAPPLPTPNGLESHSEFLNARHNGCVPKRSKSMIENVRGLFAPRSASPTTALNREPSTRSSVSNSSLLRWWSRESLRRRVRSAPDVSSEELSSSLTTRSLRAEAPTRLSLVNADRPYSQPDLYRLYSEAAGSSITTELGMDDPSLQKRRMFSSCGPRRRWTASAVSSESCAEAPAPIRIRRNFSFLHRFTRDCGDTPS